MACSSDLSLLSTSLDKVQRWVESSGYQGYEPFDGLSSYLRPLTCGTLLGERLLQQLVRQSPINLRPLLGIKPQATTKGRGYMAWGYLIRYRTTHHPEYLEKAESSLDWLDHHRAPAFARHSWSNHFDFAGRGGRYSRHDPIIVWTSLIGHAFLEAFELTSNVRWLEIADSACRWILSLPREHTETGDCLSYLALRQSSIHNANMLGAALLARTARHVGNSEYIRVARSAMTYSCSRQLPDGSWWYAEDPMYHWIDNFHTGYNLDSLKCYLTATGDEEFHPHLERGLRYYIGHFFETTGRPRYYNHRTHPVDIQCAAQSIDTLAGFSKEHRGCLELSLKVARWTIEHMQDDRGHFYYRQYPMSTMRTPMLHWGQATMFKALAELYAALAPVSDGMSGRRV